MPEYIFSATVEYRGVQIIVTAENEEEAIVKAEYGNWEESDLSGAEMTNWEIATSTIQLNE